ncbi:MAG: membrane protein insertase YidC, partial [Mycolicibacterium sp.]|nr:membrane protein insertase YidC [Mycolicibacterium sp.]
MEQRNLLIAIVLSVVILIAFQFAYERIRPPPPHPAPSSVTAPATNPDSTAAPPAPGATTNVPSASAPGAAAAHAIEPREAVIATEPRVKIETPRLHGSIDLLGARFNDLTLATYHETVDPKSPEVVLLSPSGTDEPYLAEFGWVAASPDVKVPGPQTRWTASEGPLTPNHPVTLTWDNGQGLVFTRTISVDKNYMFTIDDAVKNTGSAPVKLTPYGLISRSGTPPVSGYYILYEGPIGYLDGAIRDVKYASLTPDKPTDFTSTGGWLGFTDKYWLTALVPPQGETINAQFRKAVGPDQADHYQVDYTGGVVTVPAGGTASTSTRLFAGAKELNLLQSYAASGIPLFD